MQPLIKIINNAYTEQSGSQRMTIALFEALLTSVEVCVSANIDPNTKKIQSECVS